MMADNIKKTLREQGLINPTSDYTEQVKNLVSQVKINVTFSQIYVEYI